MSNAKFLILSVCDVFGVYLFDIMIERIQNDNDKSAT